MMQPVIICVDDEETICKFVPVSIFEVFDTDAPRVFDGKAAALTTFREAVDRYYSQDFEKARTLFQKCLKTNPGDTVAQYYFEQIKN